MSKEIYHCELLPEQVKAKSGNRRMAVIFELGESSLYLNLFDVSGDFSKVEETSAKKKDLGAGPIFMMRSLRDW